MPYLKAKIIYKILNTIFLPTFLMLLMLFFPLTILSQTNKKFVEQTLTHDGKQRTYHLHFPPTYNAENKSPLIIILHGGGPPPKNKNNSKPQKRPGAGFGRLLNWGFEEIAQKENMVIVYPDGFNNRWNDGREVTSKATENIDDVGFIEKLINTLLKKYSIDANRVYITGFSNGAIMSHTLACNLSHKITAIAPVDGGMGAHLMKTCSPERAIPVLLIHGTKVTWLMKRLQESLGKEGEPTWDDTISFWVRTNDCDNTPTHIAIPNKTRDGTRIFTDQYSDCRNRAEVLRYRVEGGGHTWPGGWQYLPPWMIGPTSREINASEVIWEFFGKHSL